MAMKLRYQARHGARSAWYGLAFVCALIWGCRTLDTEEPAGPYACCDGMWCATYGTGFVEARVATLTALADLQLPVIWEGRVPQGFGIDTQTADGSHVRVTFQMLSDNRSLQGEVTSVGVRVGGFGTHPAACSRILDQIGRHVEAPAPSPVLPTGATETPTLLPALPPQPLPLIDGNRRN
jgi:hypothetical protein